jgi:hypothetical protein
MRILAFREISTVGAGANSGIAAKASPEAPQKSDFSSYGMLKLVRELGDGAFRTIDDDEREPDYEWVCPNVPVWAVQQRGRVASRCLRARMP